MHTYEEYIPLEKTSRKVNIFLQTFGHPSRSAWQKGPYKGGLTVLQDNVVIESSKLGYPELCHNHCFNLNCYSCIILHLKQVVFSKRLSLFSS